MSAYVSPENEAFRAKIKPLWDAGHSAREIGRMVGCSRNKIIGHISRMKMPARQVTIKIAAPRHARTVPKPLPIPPPEAPPSLGLTIEALGLGHCKFPYGSGPIFSFCGHPQVPNRSWCAFHASVCFAPAKTSAT